MMMEDIQVSLKSLELMKHACGLSYPSKTPFYRNHFCACANSENDLAWAGLVEQGLAVLLSASTDMFPYNTYAVSDVGKQWLTKALGVKKSKKK
jgi:hypothetical protein